MASELTTWCPHCEPYHYDPAHRTERLEVLLASLTRPLAVPRKLANQLFGYLPIDRWFFRGLFGFLLASRALRAAPLDTNDPELPNRTRLIQLEAVRRDLTIDALTFLGRHTNFFVLRGLPRDIYFEGIPTMPLDHRKAIDIDDKLIFKELLRRHDVPHAAGAAFRTVKPALSFAQEFGYPLVVKPQAGSLTRHTSCNIQSEDALIEAIRVAQLIQPEFILEQFIPGELFRVTVVGNKLAACTWREPANVIGDGKQTIRELIEAKNSDPRRGAFDDKLATLHHILLDGRTLTELDRQNLSLDSILPAGHKVYLHNKTLMAAGADLHDVTDSVHHDNQALFEKVSKLVSEPVIAFDVIAQNMSESYAHQPFVFLEANSLPQIELHHDQVTGTSRNVAATILDYLEQTLVKS